MIAKPYKDGRPAARSREAPSFPGAFSVFPPVIILQILERKQGLLEQATNGGQASGIPSYFRHKLVHDDTPPHFTSFLDLSQLKYQKKNGLKPTGRLNKATREKMGLP
ncbi:hypothetical protein ACFL2Q_15185 [Thermodesulfobacteriota bacterium]